MDFISVRFGDGPVQIVSRIAHGAVTGHRKDNRGPVMAPRAHLRHDLWVGLLR